MSVIEAVLPGTRVLIVEDETLVGMMIEDMLEALGYANAYHTTAVEDGLHYAATGTSFAIAAMIQQRGIPFTFCTG